MIVCDKKFFERMKDDLLSVVEKKRYSICQTAEKALPDIPIFYSAQPQGTGVCAVFVRIGQMQYKKRLGCDIECAVRFEVRYLPQNSYDDIDCETVMEKLMDAFIAQGLTELVSERTKTGAVIKIDCYMKWKVIPDDNGGELMQVLNM